MTRTTDERRAYQREYARRRRAAKLAAARQSTQRCPRRFGRHGVCGALLETVIVEWGRTVVRCPACERLVRGVCRDCPAPVAGQVRKARFCAVHKRAAQQRSEAKHRDLHRRSVNRRAKLAARQPDERAKRIAYKRAWRQANPEKVKAQKRREALRQNPKRLAYHAARRERERATLAEQERQRYHGARAIRTCIVPGCQIVVTGRKKKCTRCKAADRTRALRTLGRECAA